MNTKKAEDGDTYWWAAPLGAGLVTLIALALALIAAGGWTWFAGFLGGQASSWAQFGGGVLAVFAAYKIGHTQVESSVKLEGLRMVGEELKKLNLISSLLLNAVDVTHTFRKRWETESEFRSSEPLLPYIEDCCTSISSIDLLQCPSDRVAFLLIRIPRQLNNLIAAHKSLLATLDLPATNSTDHANAAEKARAAVAAQIQHAVSLLENAHATCIQEHEDRRSKLDALVG